MSFFYFISILYKVIGSLCYRSALGGHRCRAECFDLVFLAWRSFIVVRCFITYHPSIPFSDDLLSRGLQGSVASHQSFLCLIDCGSQGMPDNLFEGLQFVPKSLFCHDHPCVYYLELRFYYTRNPCMGWSRIFTAVDMLTCMSCDFIRSHHAASWSPIISLANLIWERMRPSNYWSWLDRADVRASLGQCQRSGHCSLGSSRKFLYHLLTDVARICAFLAVFQTIGPNSVYGVF